MKKYIDKLRKVTAKQLVISGAACLVVIACVFFAKQLTFYTYNAKVTGYTIREERDDTLSLDNMPVRFSYEGRTIVLHYCRQLRSKNLILCASTLYGGGTMTQDLFESIPNYYMGSFAAVADRQDVDMDNDGSDDDVYFACKTDIRSVQTNTSVTPWINDNRLVLEPGLDLARYLLLIGLLSEAVILYTSVFSRRRRAASAKQPYRSPVRRQPASAYIAVRWICMLLAFPILVWGGKLLGCWFEDVASVGIFGRAWCGFVCPMGLMQEVLQLLRKKTRTEGIPQKEGQQNVLAAVKWTLTLLFIFACFTGADFCNFCPAVTLSPALNGFRTGIYVSGFVMLAAIAGSFFKDRFFCNICPFGLILGICGRFSPVRLKKNCTSCTECGACYRACPMGIKSIYTERDKVNVTDINCIFCGECVRHCPENDALKITFAGKPVYTSSRERYMAAYRKLSKKQPKEKKGNSGNGVC